MMDNYLLIIIIHALISMSDIRILCLPNNNHQIYYGTILMFHFMFYLTMKSLGAENVGTKTFFKYTICIIYSFSHPCPILCFLLHYVNINSQCNSKLLRNYSRFVSWYSYWECSIKSSNKYHSQDLAQFDPRWCIARS